VKLFVCGDVKAPQRKKGDAGIDFFVPNLSEQFIKDLSEKNQGHPFKWGLVGAPKTATEAQSNEGVFLYLPPGEDILIPTYVRARFNDDVFLQVNNKSGVATNQKLTFGANVIDSSYQGIIHIHVVNYCNNLRFIEFGQKLVQMIPVKFNNEDIELFYDNEVEAFKEYKNFVSKDDFYAGHETAHRGDKGFGEGTGLK